MSEQFKKGDRVRVTELWLHDAANSLRVGTEGVVTSLRKDRRYCVQFDGFEPRTSCHVLDDGYVMGEEQLELVEASAPPPKDASRPAPTIYGRISVKAPSRYTVDLPAISTLTAGEYVLVSASELQP